jgi:hypothetical protein
LLIVVVVWNGASMTFLSFFIYLLAMILVSVALGVALGNLLDYLVRKRDGVPTKGEMHKEWKKEERLAAEKSEGAVLIYRIF